CVRDIPIYFYSGSYFDYW
nr:immunoglobulin heavy chain junction region [Macaca mulatta]